MGRYSHVLKPIKIRDHIIRNRLIAAPEVPFALSDDHPRMSEAFMRHFLDKAEGGFGLVTISGVSFLPNKKSLDGAGFDIYEYENTKRMSEFIDRVHSYGSGVLFEEVPGVGMEYLDYSVMGEKGWGTGPFPEDYIREKKPLTKEIMEEINGIYATAARRLLKMGADGLVMLTTPCMWDFLNPEVNRRTDEYGGSIDNRLRFLKSTISAVRETVGDKMIIMLRCFVSRDDSGFTYDDLLYMLNDFKDLIDIAEVNIQGGLQSKPWEIMEVINMPSDHMKDHQAADIVKRLKKDGVPVPVAAIGGLQDPDDMERILGNDEADFISMARGSIADPFLGRKLYEDRAKDVLPCIRCYRCVDTPLRDRCTVNPLHGRSQYLEKPELLPKDKRLKVAVIGGGPAGIEAATIASLRGHKVTLYEKEDHLGGRLLYADVMPFKRSTKKFKKYLLDHLYETDTDIRLNATVTAEELENEGYDRVMIAIGADPKDLEVPGSERAIYAPEIYEKGAEVKGDVVIIGGGTTACETAVYLGEKGHKVTLLTRGEKLCRNAHVEYVRSILHPLQQCDNISVIYNAKIRKIDEDGVTYESEGKEASVKTDTVILAIGMKERSDEALSLWPDSIPTVMIGDCYGEKDLLHAIGSAYEAAINL